MIEDEGVIFSNLPKGRGDDDEDRRARSRAYMNMRNANQEGPLRPRPSGVGGPSIGQGTTPPPVTSVWSASDAAANGMTLTNGGLTVTPTSVASWKSIRTTIARTSGKLYVEFLASTAPDTLDIIGLADAPFTSSSYLGSNSNSVGMHFSHTEVSGGFVSNYAPPAWNQNINDVFALAVDFTAGSVWIAQNNVWMNSSNPVAGTLPIASFTPATVGALFAAMSFEDATAGTWTLQPTPASQKYLPPPGFQAWDGGPVTPSTSVWSAADAAIKGFTLTNGGLTATAPAGINANQFIRSTVGATSGKLYVEFKTTQTSGNDFFGLASASANAGQAMGNSLYSAAIGYGGNNVSAGFTSHTTTTAFAANNDVWALAVDFTAGNFWLAQNNVWLASGNPATGSLPMVSFVPATVGALFPAMTMENTGEVWTLQPTAASQKYAPPAGFSAWDGAGAHSAQATAYLARTVGGNEGGNAANIATLIDGLVADGVWAKLDALYVLAQQNATDSLLNLVGTSYSLTENSPGALVFTSYVGFSGFNGNSAWFLDTGFNGATAPSPQYTQNSASYGAWSYAVVDENLAVMGNGAVGAASIMYPSFPDGNFYARVNDGAAGGVPTPGSKGLFVGDRSTSANVIPYWNGTAQASVGSNSGAVLNNNFTIGQSQGFFAQDAPAPRAGTTQTLSAAFIGASLGSAGQLALYNRLNTYMTAVGGATHSPQALAYLARTVGGNEGGNGENIATLIDGLVADGVWAKLDALYVLAQQNQADAQLNLIGTSYGLTSVGLLRSVTFTSYVGFNGFSSFVYLNTGFNATVATTPNFAQNSGSIGSWLYTNLIESGAEIGTSVSNAGLSNILAVYNDGNFYARVNGIGAPGVTSPATKGLYVGDRSSSASVVPYYNGSPLAAQTNASQSPENAVFFIGTAGNAYTSNTLSAAFIGASLGSAGQLALYNRLRTYMTAIGVP